MHSPVTLAFDSPDDLAEALYYAFTSASLVLGPEPHGARPDVLWEDLPLPSRLLWRTTAARLVALNADHPK